MASVPIPLVGAIETRDVTLTKDSKVVNGYAEKLTTGVAVVKRPGAALWATPNGVAGVAQGIGRYLDKLFVALDGTFYIDGLSQSLGSTEPIDFTGPISLPSNNAGLNSVQVPNIGGTGWGFGGSGAQIVSNSPAALPDGTLIVLPTGTYWIILGAG